jgi:hypothetical protein
LSRHCRASTVAWFVTAARAFPAAVAPLPEGAMIPRVLQAYTDAVYVATMLRAPLPPQQARESEHVAEREADRPAAARIPVGGRLTRWAEAGRQALRRRAG